MITATCLPTRPGHAPTWYALPNASACLHEPAFPYGEDLLQFIWERQLFQAEGLRTMEGEEVLVLKAGRVQHHSGPDLVDACVRIAGQTLAGTIEVHARSSEWEAHGHHRDPAYENVVLHVVHTCDGRTRTLRGRNVPTVELRGRIPQEQLARFGAWMQRSGTIACADRLPTVDPLRIGPWLERLLVERLQRRTERVLALYRQLGNDLGATFHHMLLQGLGFGVNAEAFGMLAQAVPARLAALYRDDAVRLEALLFGQAGLLPHHPTDAYTTELAREHALLARSHGLAPMARAAWKFGRLRPVNLPTVRIAQAAALIHRLEGGAGTIVRAEGLAAFRRLFDVVAGPYWTDHLHFGASARSRTKRLGTASADLLVVNTVVPYLFAMGRALGHERWCEQALYLLVEAPPERNATIREWAAAGIKADSAARSQSLMELKTLYCRQRRCLHCVIGAHVMGRRDERP